VDAPCTESVVIEQVKPCDGLFAIIWTNEIFLEGKHVDKAKWWLVNIFIKMFENYLFLELPNFYKAITRGSLS